MLQYYVDMQNIGNWYADFMQLHRGLCGSCGVIRMLYAVTVWIKASYAFFDF